MLWEECTKKTRALGGKVLQGEKVVGCAYDAATKKWTITSENNGARSSLVADHVISSAPLRELAHGLTPQISDHAMKAADSLKYRDFLTVMLILNDRELFDDNWIYIHDSEREGRAHPELQVVSPEMVPDPTKCCYGLEYFCFEGDGLWSSSDEQLIELAKKELEKIGLGNASEVLDGCVVRQKKAYPTYDDDYAKHVDALRAELAEKFPTLHPVGATDAQIQQSRHAMMTAMLTVEKSSRTSRLRRLAGQPGRRVPRGSKAGAASGASGLRQVPTKVKDAPVPPAG